MDNIFGTLQLAIGVYLLYCGISAKGQMYKNENVKKGMEALYKKRMRIFSLILGPLMIIMGAVDYLMASSEWYLTVFTVLWIISLIVIAALVITTVRMTDKEAQRSGKREKAAPRSAFEFDDEDEGLK